jgi:hypothetical protein
MADLAATSRRTKEDGDFNPLGTDLSVTTVHGVDPNKGVDTASLPHRMEKVKRLGRNRHARASFYDAKDG